MLMSRIRKRNRITPIIGFCEWEQTAWRHDDTNNYVIIIRSCMSVYHLFSWYVSIQRSKITYSASISQYLHSRKRVFMNHTSVGDYTWIVFFVCINDQKDKFYKYLKRYTNLHFCPGNKPTNTVKRLDDLQLKHYPDVPIPLSQAPAAQQDLHNSLLLDIDTRTCFDLWQRNQLDISRQFLRKSFPRKYPEMIRRKDKKLIN